MSTNFALFLIASLIIAYADYKKLIRPAGTAAFLFLLYSISFVSSLSIPYISDDTDHFFYLAQALDQGKAVDWIFTPHNEHVFPLLKLFYVIFYQNFWLSPLPFHLLIMVINVGIAYVSYRLVLNLTRSRQAALLTAAVIAGTNLYDLAIYIICDSHILFCLFFLLCLFYGQVRYARGPGLFWLVIICLATLLAPATFALGLPSIFFAFLLDKFYLRKTIPGPAKSPLLLISVCWLISLLPYLLAIHKIIFADHYRDLHQKSLFDIMNVAGAAGYLLYHLFYDVIPRLTPEPYVSMGLFFMAVLGVWRYRSSLPWKLILFFLLFGLLNNLIIFSFRIAWGVELLVFARYYVFTSVAVAICYGLASAAWFKNNNYLNGPRQHLIFVILCFFIVSWSSAWRFDHGTRVVQETVPTIQRFNEEYRMLIENYLKENPQVQQLALEDRRLIFVSIPSLRLVSGYEHTFMRYPRSLSFFGQYLIGPAARKRIVWGPQSDPHFIEYLKARQDQYQSYLYFTQMAF